MDNYLGVVGINPYAQIMPIKAGYQVGSESFMFTANLALAVDFARYNGAKIINASW